jgi:hypothetical protein
MVARQYDVNANMVFTWCKLCGGAPDKVPAQLVPAVVTPDPPVPAIPAPSAELSSADLIEVELSRGYRIRIDGNIKASMLRIVLESVSDHILTLQSFLSMRRIDAQCKKASPFRFRHSQSLARRRHLFSQPMVRSTTQRLGSTAKPFVVSERFTISTWSFRRIRRKA